MSYIKTIFSAVITTVLALGVWGGEVDFVQEIQHDFSTNLFARQDQQLRAGPINLNFFDESLGGAKAPPITPSNDPNHPYEINGQVAPDYKTAVDKTCDFQKNDCAELANGALKDQFSVPDCDEQSNRCKSILVTSAVQTAFLSKVTADGIDDFDFFCEN